ncbi:MAG: hypothetical protein K8R67_08030 [Desulfobacteraceae bacterium]|nr:hypothetical protein [Desulfobacteraceae bacterium]
MGAILFKIFKIVEIEGGVSARLKFAQKVKISINNVKKIKDKPEYINKFVMIAQKILGKDINDLLPPSITKPADNADGDSIVVEFDPYD